MPSAQPAFTAGQVGRFRAFVTSWIGFELDDEKLWSLSDLLRLRLRERGCDAEAYLAGLESAGPLGGAFSEELQALAHELTINETSFFRNADQMAAFAEVALPDRLATQRPLRILSAGCASGEEPYSLAMLVHSMAAATGRPTSITAIDADATVLKKAALARYSAWSLRQTPPDFRVDYFRTVGREFLLCETIRKMVTFQERNLVAGDPGFWAPGSFDIVFCRNVIMYFTPQVARAVVERITASLAPGGFLFLGLAETLRGLSQDFHLRHTHGTFYYQRPGADEQPLRERAAAESPAGVNFVDAIDGASRRIRSLAASSAPVARGPAPEAAPDLAPVLELLHQDRAGEALALLRRLPGADDARALVLQAVLLTHGGDLGQAERVCTDLLARDELNAGAHYLMALCRESAGDPDGAARCDRMAVHLDPGFAMPRLHLGLLARRAGDYQAACRELSQAETLLRCEDNARLMLFGGGFDREALAGLCQAQRHACGGH